MARIEDAFSKYFYRELWDRKKGDSEPKETYELVVCHGNVIRYLCCRSLQLPPEAWSRFVVNNCSVTHIEIRPSGEVCLLSLGDTSQLPEHYITFN